MRGPLSQTSTNEIEGFLVQVHVGGLPETFTSREKKQVLHLPETVASPNFVGCMKNVSASTYLSCTVYSWLQYFWCKVRERIKKILAFQLPNQIYWIVLLNTTRRPQLRRSLYWKGKRNTTKTKTASVERAQFGDKVKYSGLLYTDFWETSPKPSPGL